MGNFQIEGNVVLDAISKALMSDIILHEQAKVVGIAVLLMYNGVTSIGVTFRMRQHRVTYKSVER